MNPKFKLPLETNSKIDTDEMQGEYICKKCRGWGYIVKRKEFLGKLATFPITLCSDCDGGGIIDWAKRPTQN